MSLADYKTNRPGKALRAGLLALCLLMLSAQVTDLGHSHGGNIDPQAGCEICSKFGSDDDIAPAAGQALPSAGRMQSAAGHPDFFSPPPLLSFQARAPPAR